MSKSRKIVVFTCPAEQESAERLGFETVVGSKVYKEDYSNDVCVRWGLGYHVYSKRSPQRVDFDSVINPARAIQLNVQKPLALQTMATVVNTPKMYHNSVPKNVLAVYRPTSHAAGAGFFVAKGPFKVENEHYATHFLKTDTEYRMFFCGNRTMCARRIANRTHVPTKYTCRSMFAYRFCDIPRGLDVATLKAAKVIGLDAGAADILQVGKDFVFLEMNSAVTCDWDIIINFYKNGLLDLAEQRFGKKKKMNFQP